MSETLIASLQKRLDELTTENASLKAENKDRRIKGKASLAELETLREQAKALTTERDTFKVKAEAGPKELNDRIAELEGTLRGRDHRDAFASVKEFEVAGQDGKAKKYQLAEGVKLDALWQLTQYKAEGETPDAKAVSAKYGEALQAHPFLFSEVAAPAPGGATRPTAVQAREGGPGAGRGTDSPTVTAASGGQAGTKPTGRIPGRF